MIGDTANGRFTTALTMLFPRKWSRARTMATITPKMPVTMTVTTVIPAVR